MKTKSEMAVEKFVSGYNCAQSVLYVWGADLGLDQEPALKLATGFGGGIARQGGVCGALTGGILALGLKYGRGGKDDRSKTELTYGKAQELTARFQKRHGSHLCRTLLDGCDLRTAERQRQFKERNFHNTICAACVRGVVEDLAQLLAEPAPPASGAKLKGHSYEQNQSHPQT